MGCESGSCLTPPEDNPPDDELGAAQLAGYIIIGLLVIGGGYLGYYIYRKKNK